jgi:hypothetical protein
MLSDQLRCEVAAGEGEKLSVLARRVPSYRSGKPASLSRLLRWVLDGVRGPDGQRVYMEALRTPSGWISTPRAISRFFEALTPTTTEPNAAPAPKPRTERQRLLAAERAGKQLEKLGV